MGLISPGALSASFSPAEWNLTKDSESEVVSKGYYADPGGCIPPP